MALTGTLLRYWHTVRHLRLRQVVWRALRLLPQPIWIRSTPIPLRSETLKSASWARSVPTITGPNSVRFLNRTRDLGETWTEPEDESLLWRYNLHYFDDLAANGAEGRRSDHAKMVDQWIRQNPPGAGVAWEPYPTSRRIVNWIKSELAGWSLGPVARRSLAIQARWLRRNLEYHLLGNHLLANAKALAFAGTYFGGSEANRWLRLGKEILREEIREQFLPDGGHFELAPMYHAIAVEDLLDVFNLARANPHLYEKEFIGLLADRVPLALRWLIAMTHPDGGVAHFNDSVDSGPVPVSELIRYARCLGVRMDADAESVSLQESGYVRIRRGDGLAILDVARIGPDYLPGHSHADTLSFELSIAGCRLIVNTGISEYGTGETRQRQRATEAHSTVQVCEADSSEVWAGFRVARRAVPYGIEIDLDRPSARVRASHTGYHRLRKHPTHTREWQMADRELIVCDSVLPSCPAVARYHIHPSWEVVPDKNRFELRSAHLRAHLHVLAGQPRLAPSTYHRGFGVAADAMCIEVILESGACKVDISW